MQFFLKKAEKEENRTKEQMGQTKNKYQDGLNLTMSVVISNVNSLNMKI